MKPKPEVLDCPFSIVIDSREQLPYTFNGLRSNADKGNLPLRVLTQRLALPTGDYAIFGHPGGAVVERKSKADLYSSISQHRENFEDRLERMCVRHFAAAIVVEAELGDVIANPPPHTQFNPKALFRTILAWMIRWPKVNWLFLPSRELAEAATFRFLEKYWEHCRAGLFSVQEVRTQLRWHSRRPDLAPSVEVKFAHPPGVSEELAALNEADQAMANGKVLVGKGGRKYFVDAIEFEGFETTTTTQTQVPGESNVEPE